MECILRAVNLKQHCQPLCFGILLPQEAINLLEPMTNDPVNYVRQGALIASALIMIQQTEVTCPKVSELPLKNKKKQKKETL